MNAEDCSTDCPEFNLTPIGIKLHVIARANSTGNTDYAGCEYLLDGDVGMAYPAIPISTPDGTKLKNGSAFFPIILPFDTHTELRPIIVTESGVFKRFVPPQQVGKKMVIAKNGKIYLMPYLLPSYVSTDLTETANPDFYLGANYVQRLCSDGKLPIQLLKIENVGDPPELPIAVDDDIEAEFETPFNFNAIANDTGTDIEVTDVSDPPHGTATIEMDGTITYEPDASYDGPDSFTYEITDGALNTSVATVNVTVNPEPGADVGELCDDDCSILDENRPLSVIPAAEMWIDAFCQSIVGGTVIDSFQDGSTRNNDVSSTGGNRPTWDTVGVQGILFDETNNEYLTKASFSMFNSGSATPGMMIAVASVDGGFAGTRIPIACWGPEGSPLMSIEFDFSGSWSVTGKINGQTRVATFDPVGKMFIVAVGNNVDFGSGAASFMRIYELTGGSVAGGTLTHSPGSTTFTAGQSGDLFIGGMSASDSGSFKLHEFIMFSKSTPFGTASGDPDPACFASKWT